jgi:hypothetical protein
MKSITLCLLFAVSSIDCARLRSLESDVASSSKTTSASPPAAQKSTEDEQSSDFDSFDEQFGQDALEGLGGSECKKCKRRPKFGSMFDPFTSHHGGCGCHSSSDSDHSDCSHGMGCDPDDIECEDPDVPDCEIDDLISEFPPGSPGQPPNTTPG